MASGMPAIEVRPSGISGLGVFALQTLEPGAVILGIDDSRVVDEAHPLDPDAGEFGSHRDYLPDGTVVLMRPPERHINHSCDPNCFVYSVHRRRFVIAMRPVARGEEIVYDYAINAVGGETWECRCGSPRCRGRHKCDYFGLPPERQREYLPYLDPWFAEIHAGRILALLESSRL